MSEQESNIPAEEEDVELHKKRNTMASDEPGAEGETEGDDVELHRSRRTVAASDEPSAEGETEGDDDVELHGLRNSKVL